MVTTRRCRRAQFSGGHYRRDGADRGRSAAARAGRTSRLFERAGRMAQLANALAGRLDCIWAGVAGMALLLGARNTLQHFYAATSYAFIPLLLGALAFVPVLGWLLGLAGVIWAVVVYFHAARAITGLDTLRMVISLIALLVAAGAGPDAVDDDSGQCDCRCAIVGRFGKSPTFRKRAFAIS
ncbi:MAG: Yip1 family protein [Caldilineaceae bacterium]